MDDMVTVFDEIFIKIYVISPKSTLLLFDFNGSKFHIRKTKRSTKSHIVSAASNRFLSKKIWIANGDDNNKSYLT